MGREVRMVPATWEHPKNERTDDYIPLHEGYDQDKKDFEKRQAEKGLQEALEYHGVAPNTDDYMPEWPTSEKTHYMMYETCSEGTPLSPAHETPEKLARWLTDNKASAFGDDTASYEGWLNVANGGYAPSMVISGGVMRSGVEAFKD